MMAGIIWLLAVNIIYMALIDLQISLFELVLYFRRLFYNLALIYISSCLVRYTMTPTRKPKPKPKLMCL